MDTNIEGEQVTQVSEPQEQPASVEYVTKADLETLSEKLRREAQSMIDSNVSRIDKRVAETNKRVEEQIKAFQDAGVTLTPEQIQKVKAQEMNKALAAAPEHEQQLQQQTSGDAEYVNIMAQNMMKSAGVNITEESPGFAFVDLETKDPYKFLKSVEKAIDHELRIRQSAGNPAAVPGDVAGKGQASSTLNDQYTKEMIAARGKGKLVRKAIMKKYQDMGVDVGSVGFTL